MAVIDKSSNDKVILLPQTVDYYQKELTRMLETERFGEAIRLLDFLLDCRADDPQISDEWKTLLNWLQTTFASGQEKMEDGEEEDVTEQDFLKQRFYTKMSEDPGYVKKLLETLLGDSGLEKKMAALEQLTVAEHPQIDETLKRWVQQVDLHPLVQYKVLQTLRARGSTGTVSLLRGGEQITVEIADTPLDMIHYSERIQQVMELVKTVCEVEHPSLVYFAEHTWKEFLACTYGTSLFKALERMEEGETREWAAALHHAVVESMSGSGPKEDVFRLYDLKENAFDRFDQHRGRFYAFIRQTFLP